MMAMVPRGRPRVSIDGEFIGNAYHFDCSCTLTAMLDTRDYEHLVNGAPQPCSIQDAIALRGEAGLPAEVSAKSVAWVVDRVGGDVGLALDALTMIPRPAWVGELLGLHPER